MSRIQTVAQEADAVSNCGCDGDFGPARRVFLTGSIYKECKQD